MSSLARGIPSTTRRPSRPTLTSGEFQKRTDIDSSPHEIYQRATVPAIYGRLRWTVMTDELYKSHLYTPPLSSPLAVKHKRATASKITVMQPEQPWWRSGSNPRLEAGRQPQEHRGPDSRHRRPPKALPLKGCRVPNHHGHGHKGPRKQQQHCEHDEEGDLTWWVVFVLIWSNHLFGWVSLPSASGLGCEFHSLHWWSIT